MIDLEFFIPFYGDPAYLWRAINGIRSLVDTHWRLTIVEDSYPDGLVVERDVKALDDERIRYVRNEQNMGVNANIHQCIRLAEWDHFVITDFDDVVMPNYGMAVASLLERHPEASLIQPAVAIIDECDRPTFPLPDRIKSLIRPGGNHEFALRGERAVASLLHGNWLYTPAGVLRRDAFQKTPFRPEIDAAHDLAFVIDVLLGGGSLVLGTEVAYQYRRFSSSHSSSLARSGMRFHQESRYFAEISEELKEAGWHSAARAARMHLTSRLNAATQLPEALRARETEVARALLRYAVGR